MVIFDNLKSLVIPINRRQSLYKKRKQIEKSKKDRIT
jgi:hypothetical protein